MYTTSIVMYNKLDSPLQIFKCLLALNRDNKQIGQSTSLTSKRITIQPNSFWGRNAQNNSKIIRKIRIKSPIIHFILKFRIRSTSM